MATIDRIWPRPLSSLAAERPQGEGTRGRKSTSRSSGRTTFTHETGRTITEADNVFFSTLTMNPQPLHIDFHAAAKAEFGKPLVNSLLTLGDRRGRLGR
jgi:acyl dehydratase